MAEEDTWEGLENLENTMDLVKEFKKEIRKEEIKRIQMRNEKGKESIESGSRGVQEE